MKQVINLAEPEVSTKIVDSPIPEPEPKQILIKVVVSGSNPKDWKMPQYSMGYKDPEDGTMMARSSKGVNQGDDIAGIVEKVGADVIGFKVSLDRCHMWEARMLIRSTCRTTRKEIGSRRSTRWRTPADRMQNTPSDGTGPLSTFPSRSLSKASRTSGYLTG